jgi:hypothetical protein
MPVTWRIPILLEILPQEIGWTTCKTDRFIVKKNQIVGSAVAKVNVVRHQNTRSALREFTRQSMEKEMLRSMNIYGTEDVIEKQDSCS